jgi:hypothetical protein
MLLFMFETHSKLSVSWPALSRLSAAARTVFADKGRLDPMQLVLPPFTAAAIRIYNEAGIVIETYEHKDDFKGVVNRPICSSIEQTSQRRPRTLQV